MAVMRVHKSANYTVMSNYHFKEKEMSLKAKGLLSLMLSLPDDWDYSVAGLATLSKDGKDSVITALKELEKFKYLKRTRVTDAKGRIKGYDYDIFEQPQNDTPEAAKRDPKTPETATPEAAKPTTGEPDTGNPHTDEPQQLSTNVLTTKESSTEHKVKIDKAQAPEPNGFTKELIRYNYIEQDDLFIQEYNDFMQDVANEHDFAIARSCLLYFLSRYTGKDANGQDIINKLAYFKEAIDYGLCKTSPYYEKKNIPANAFSWLKEA